MRTYENIAGGILALTSTGEKKWVSAGRVGGLTPSINPKYGIFTVSSPYFSPLTLLNDVDGSVIFQSVEQVGLDGLPPSIGSNDDVYISGSGGLVAFHPNGTKAWERLDLRYIGRGQPVIGPDGIIYLIGDIGGPGGSFLHAFNPNGTDKFIVRYDGYYLCGSPVIGNNGTIYAASWTHGLIAFDATGKILWDTAGSFKANISFSPIMGPDGIFM